ncbi:hypothetical protein EV361DRAFT_960453 [Lentinula raphanica]|nr:hypothetical protein F5880DRAFT_1576365 [Lentinula raphanica]KAJ3974188.1 hypothetical protein EV361DRAFT_960453 [Lentinula raphanica]
MPRISEADKMFARDTAAEWHEYDRLLARHGAIIRTYPNYLEFMRTTYSEAEHLPSDFMPESQAERDEHLEKMKECIRTLESSNDLFDHFQVAGAAWYICRKLARDAQDRGHDVWRAVLRGKNALRRAYPITNDTGLPSDSSLAGNFASLPTLNPPPQSSNPVPNPSLTPVSENPPRRKDTPVSFPPAMPVQASFNWSAVNRARTTSISPQQLQQWIEKPDTLPLHQVFVGDIDGTEEAYKVVIFMNMGSEKVFYVQFVERDEAIGYSSNDFIDLLLQARVVEPN